MVFHDLCRMAFERFTDTLDGTGRDVFGWVCAGGIDLCAGAEN